MFLGFLSLFCLVFSGCSGSSCRTSPRQHGPWPRQRPVRSSRPQIWTEMARSAGKVCYQATADLSLHFGVKILCRRSLSAFSCGRSSCWVISGWRSNDRVCVRSSLDIWTDLISLLVCLFQNSPPLWRLHEGPWGTSLIPFMTESVSTVFSLRMCSTIPVKAMPPGIRLSLVQRGVTSSDILKI